MNIYYFTLCPQVKNLRAACMGGPNSGSFSGLQSSCWGKKSSRSLTWSGESASQFSCWWETLSPSHTGFRRGLCITCQLTYPKEREWERKASLFHYLILEVFYTIGHTGQPWYSIGGNYTRMWYQEVGHLGGPSWRLATTELMITH